MPSIAVLSRGSGVFRAGLGFWGLPAPPKYLLVEPLWSLIVGISGMIEGSWGVLVQGFFSGFLEGFLLGFF